MVLPERAASMQGEQSPAWLYGAHANEAGGLKAGAAFISYLCNIYDKIHELPESYGDISELMIYNKVCVGTAAP